MRSASPRPCGAGVRFVRSLSTYRPARPTLICRFTFRAAETHYRRRFFSLHGSAASENSPEPARSHAAAGADNGTPLAPTRQCQSVPFTTGFLTLILPSLSSKIIAASS
jgi:hypothetical protein